MRHYYAHLEGPEIIQTLVRDEAIWVNSDHNPHYPVMVTNSSGSGDNHGEPEAGVTMSVSWGTMDNGAFSTWV